MEEVGHLKEFKPVSGIIGLAISGYDVNITLQTLKKHSVIVKYVCKSTITCTLLKEDAVKSQDPARTLAPTSVGKTRFASKWNSMMNLAPHLRYIQQMVETGKITIEVCNLSLIWLIDTFGQRNKVVRNFFNNSFEVNQFELATHQYTQLMAPFAHTLWSLEATRTVASDVFIFWLAAASSVKDALQDTQLGLTSSVKQAVITVINKQWHAFIKESPEDIYFTAFYLDPHWCFRHKFGLLLTGYAKASFLKQPNVSLRMNTITIPLTQQISVDDDILFPHAHDHAKNFLVRLLKAELALAENHCDEPEQTLIGPLLMKYGRKDTLVRAFGDQLRAFGSDRAPFKAGQRSDVDSFRWWKKLTGDEDADILAVSLFPVHLCSEAVRLFVLRFSRI